jgi:hypothetical protein
MTLAGWCLYKNGTKSYKEKVTRFYLKQRWICTTPEYGTGLGKNTDKTKIPIYSCIDIRKQDKLHYKGK